jgi:hypothetical protein
MTLRSQDIRCVGGECYAYVFENRKAGIARGVFWNFILECAPITWNGEEWETALLCDWITPPNRKWRGMTGVSLSALTKPDLVEASFYLSSHHDLRLNRLDIAHERGDLFRVDVAGDFDLKGYDDLDGTAIPVETSGAVRFEGLIIVADNLFPKPSGVADAVAIAEPFLDLESFAEPIWDGSRYLFKPRVDAV